MSTATITIVHEAELRSPRQHGHRIRAYCPVHGGDRQRSLSIEAPGGEHAGYGYCHTCHTTVFVPEMNPDEAARREGGQGRGPSAPRRITPAALLRPMARQAPDEPTPEEWQRAELEALTRLYPRMRERLADDRARAYLEGRGIPWEIADGAGVGYVPAEARLAGPLAKWRDRLVFPLGSPAGTGYAGRSLHGWALGMDENAHKELLDSDPAGPRRWEKTYPAGWFGYDALVTSERVAICEGPFDRLALVASGLGLDDVVALVGTAARPEWIPANVGSVVLALDGDAAGQERAKILRHELLAVGIKVPAPCTPAAGDGRGKDWAERWRVASLEGVYPVLADLDALAGSGEPVTLAEVAEDSSVLEPAPSASAETAETAETPGTLARADSIVRYLMAHGHELAEVIGAAPER